MLEPECGSAGCVGSVHVAESDVLRFLRGRAYQPYDVIFADPPYGENRLVPTLKAIMKGGWLAPDGYLLAEIEGLLRFDAAAAHEELELEIDRNYGQTRIILWHKTNE